MSIKGSRELKQLQSRKAKLEVDVDAFKQDMIEKQKAHSKAVSQLQEVDKQIGSLQDLDVIISEHSIIRYMERAMGLDIDQIKDQILTEDMLISIKAMGSGKYPMREGLTAVVKDNTIVTVV